MRARAVEKNFQLYNKLFSFMAPNPGTRGFSRKYDGDVLRSADMSSAETLIEPKAPRTKLFGDLANSCVEMFFKIRKLAYFLPSVVQGEESATPNKICL